MEMTAIENGKYNSQESLLNRTLKKNEKHRVLAGVKLYQLLPPNPNSNCHLHYEIIHIYNIYTFHIHRCFIR